MLNIFYKIKYMETLRKHSLFLLSALVLATTCCAQTAQEIVEKNLQAVGGKDVIAGIKSLVVQSNIDIQGNPSPSTTTILAGKGYKNETDFMGTKIVTCITDKGGWMINPPMGAATATALPDDAVKASQSQLSIVPLASYASGKLELLGKDTADYKIKFTGAGGQAATYYINTKTYYVEKVQVTATIAGQTQETTISFGDYRKTDSGLLYPFSISRVLPQYTLNIVVTSVVANKDIDPKVFDKP
jgi:outer membrane lipoprotein-sorting protein